MNCKYILNTFSLTLLLCFATVTRSEAQAYSFKHLNTSNGLSDNNVRCMTVDKNGFLWIGTTDGLDVYDGHSVTTYLKEREPELASNSFTNLECDSANRIWIATTQGVSWTDGTRKFHRVTINDTVTKFSCQALFQTKTYGIVLYTTIGQFYFDSTAMKWKQLDWIPYSLRPSKFQDGQFFDKDKIIYATDSAIIILDYAAKKISYQQPFQLAVSACRVNDKQIAVGIQVGRVQIIDMATTQVVKDYQLTHDLEGREANTNLREVKLAPNGDLIVSTGFAGLGVIHTATGRVSTYTHDPLQPGSISANNVYRIYPAASGDVIIASTTAGVNIYNIYNKQAGYKSVFEDAQGNLFDNFLDEMIEDKNGIIWIGAFDRLIRWNRKTEETKYYYYYRENKLQGVRNLEMRTLCFDKYGKLWVGALGHGIAVFDEKTGNFTRIENDTTQGKAPLSHYVHDLLAASDGKIWACTNTGFYTVDPITHAVSTFNQHPVLKEICDKRTIGLYEDRRGYIWIAVSYVGVYCYQPKENKLTKFTQKDGLVSNVCFAFREDLNGNMYMGAQEGFSIITPAGTIRSFTRKNGLRYDRCEGFLPDNSGAMWISNNKCLLKFDPVTSKMEFFDEGAGLSVYGFRFDCFLKTKEGELLWGGQRGINYFYPDQLANNPSLLKAVIFQVVTRDSSLQFDNDPHIDLSYTKNDVQFYFTAITFAGLKKIEYQYKLDGYDNDWQSGTDIKQVRYSSLPPGQYVFKVKASTDGNNWITAANEVHVTIRPPLWQRWWFMGAVFSLIVGGLYWLFSNRNQKIKEQQEEIETEQAINYFASSMSEQQTEDDILWDVARNCIGRLQFEDCVIYILDEKRDVLIQKAAHGPKSPNPYRIEKPIGIPVGRGIVGSVAFSGKAEIVNDTSMDPRYIVDDQVRLSEITVPIVSNGRVLGVIDCEHSKKRFFTQKHLSILTTIASLCANKIIRVRAEEEKQEAKTQLMSTQQKMAEVEMQALRAQMNPHFIFNCLNSINRYIVKSDQATASLYLTRFAKLIRLILDNSNSKTIILSNELEALKLYIEMEALRFDKKFTYKINIDPAVITDSVELPPLIIQPYVENAIWHGLLHKEQDGHLSVNIGMEGDSMLTCVIEDNGVGREKARELKSKTVSSRKSVGLQLTESRLVLLNKHSELNASIEIIDLHSAEGNATGTRVVLKIPI